MFITDSANKINLLSKFAGARSTYWRAVELGLNLPWYLATVWETDLKEPRHRSTETRFTRSVLIAEIEDVIGLCDRSKSNMDVIKLVSVDVVIPEHMNEAKGWLMRPIVAIWGSADPRSLSGEEDQAYSLETAEGDFYPVRPGGHTSSEMHLIRRLPAAGTIR